MLKQIIAISFLTAAVLSADIITAGDGFTTDPILVTANNVPVTETTTIKVLVDSVLTTVPSISPGVPACGNVPSCYSAVFAEYSFAGSGDQYGVDCCTPGSGVFLHNFTYLSRTVTLATGTYDLVQTLDGFPTYLPNGYPGIYAGPYTVSVYVKNGKIVLPNAAPEPGTTALFGFGALGLLFTGRRQRKADRT